jgi:hypothetical protein
MAIPSARLEAEDFTDTTFFHIYGATRFFAFFRLFNSFFTFLIGV